MNRPRRVNPDGLPPCVYWKNGAFWLVKRRKWTRLGADRREALTEYARMSSAPKTGSMPDLIDRVLKYHIRAEQLSEQTANAYQSAAKRLKDVFKDFEPGQIRPKHVAALRVADSETPGAANRNQTVLKIVFRYAMEEGIVDTNPVQGARPLKMQARRRYISSDEFWRIHAQAGERLRVIMELCFLTGQRIGDVLAIKFDDLGEDGIYFDQEKTDTRLRIAYTPELLAVLERAKGLLTSGKVALIPQGWLLRGELAHKRHKAPRYATVLAQWRAACDAAGVENANLHDLRAKSATDGDEQGRDVTALLGHTNAKQTETYLRKTKVPLVMGPTMKGAK